MIRIGDTLRGRYLILQEIGTGGVGVIFLAEDLNLKQKVVVKKIKENFVDALETRSEVDILKRLRHTCLPRVYDFFQDERDVYTVMDYIEGCDMQQYLQQGIVTPERQVTEWLVQLLDVLSYLHSQTPPIYHSDIKPANIMITPQGEVCLIDFNISLGDEEKTVRGLSKWYSAPEQRRAAEDPGSGIILNGQMDLYSLGTSFYSLMTGYYPDTEKESVWTEASEAQYSSGLRNIISRAMERERRKRYSSAEKMKAALLRKKNWDADDRKIWLIRTLVYAVSVLFVTCGGSMVLYGSHRISADQWKKEKREFQAAAEELDEEELIRRGIDLLNSESARKNMKDSERGDLLWQIGNAWYYLEDYESAAEYYRMSQKYLPDEKELSVDYVIALIRDDRLDLATACLNDLEGTWAYSDELTLLRGEVLLKQQKYEEAGDIAERLYQSSASTEICKRAAELAADVCEAQDEKPEALGWLKKANRTETDRNLMRRIVDLALELSAEAEEYGEQAIQYAENICTFWPMSATDQLRLAVVRADLGQTEAAKELLQKLYEEKTGLYQVPMNLAILMYNAEISGGNPSEEEYRKFLEYGDEAWRLYRENDAARNEDMEDLRDICEKIRKARNL